MRECDDRDAGKKKWMRKERKKQMLGEDDTQLESGERGAAKINRMLP